MGSAEKLLKAEHGSWSQGLNFTFLKIKKKNQQKSKLKSNVCTTISIYSCLLQRCFHSVDGGTDLVKPGNANKPSLAGASSEGSMCPVSNRLVLQRL